MLNEVRRAAPGDVNERRLVGLLEVGTLALAYLELEEPQRWAVLGLAWSPLGPLLVDRATDDQVDRAVALVDPATRAVRVVWRDHGERRIYTQVAAAWHPDGRRLLLTGDLDDRYRLYLLTPGEAQPRPLTPGPADVEGGALAGPGWPHLYYVSGEPRPEERQVWRLPAEGGPRERVSPLPGTNRPFVSPDGAAVAFLHSDDAMPQELFLGARRITRSPPPEFAATRWATVRYATVKGSTAGVDLHLRILEPPGLDRRRRHPVVFGPVYTDTVFEVPVIDAEGATRTVRTHVYTENTIRRRRFPILEEEMRRRGYVRSTRVGASELLAVNVRDAVDTVLAMHQAGRYFYEMSDFAPPGTRAAAATPQA